MDEDTAMWKEGVRPLMEAQKGKNNILFERLFSGNKKINALTEVKEDQYLNVGSLSKTGPLRFASENQFPLNSAHEYILVQK